MLRGPTGLSTGVAIYTLLPSFALFVKLMSNVHDSEPDRS
jgi:hypothetical protein